MVCPSKEPVLTAAGAAAHTTPSKLALPMILLSAGAPWTSD